MLYDRVADLPLQIDGDGFERRERGIDMYGGGQFELDVGREHLHSLASLFYTARRDSINTLSDKWPVSELETLNFAL